MTTDKRRFSDKVCESFLTPSI